MRINILVVDDDPVNLVSTKELLESWGYRVDITEKPSEALTLIQNSKEYAVILLDYLMPEMNGARLAERIARINDEAVILMYSCEDTRDANKDSLRVQVVTDFIDKDEDIPTLKKAIENAVKKFECYRTLKPNQSPSENQKILAEFGLIGTSAGMAKAVALAKRFKSMDDYVMITGESGTGKEIIAHALHDPTKGPFMVVNCASFKEPGLVDAELYGYEKGSFTGALARKIGMFEKAGRGTLFLDELHHLGESAQAKLLRAAREREIRRVGSNDAIAIHCRIIVATKPDIHKKAANGEFLGDLYFRLKKLLIEIPALRDRKEDIPLLVQYFCDEYNKKNGTNKKFLTRTIRAFENYPWPGNIGELDGTVVNLLASSTKNQIEPKDLWDHFELPADDLEASEFTLEDFERKQLREKHKYIESVILSSDSQRHAAKRLGINESTLRGQLERIRG